MVCDVHNYVPKRSMVIISHLWIRNKYIFTDSNPMWHYFYITCDWHISEHHVNFCHWKHFYGNHVKTWFFHCHFRIVKNTHRNLDSFYKNKLFLLACRLKRKVGNNLHPGDGNGVRVGIRWYDSKFHLENSLRNDNCRQRPSSVCSHPCG